MRVPSATAGARASARAFVLFSMALLGFGSSAGPPLASDAQPAPAAVVESFETDPVLAPGVVLEGAALARLRWNADPPAFPGDRPGSLTARYDATMDAGRIGWPLPAPWSQDDPFVAAAVFVIEPQGFVADPFGFFQISWGLWNSTASGFERTGTPQSFAGDTFELIEFDYFPNVSPFFGGPFLTPSVFGTAHQTDPLFGFLGSFANVAFGSVQASLPLGEPLLARMEHRPADDALVVSVARITPDGGLLPVPGAVTVVPLATLPLREYTVDTIGLTLWRDGFSGPDPSLRADVTFHAIVARPGAPVAAGGPLHAARPGG